MSNLDPYLALTIAQNVAAALSEDVRDGDVTAQLIPDRQGSAFVLSRASALLCGMDWFNACFKALDPHITINWTKHDGERLNAGERFCHIQGNSRAILTAERAALNFLQTLSSTASVTRAYVDAIAGTHAVIMDTRKTLPGLRAAQKYAVRVGGGENQRFGLFDGILIKENHITAAGSLKLALAQALNISKMPIQIEVENLAQLAEALEAGAKLILLDNFDIDELRRAVLLNENHENRAILEASGGISLANVRVVAETGVNRISIGALTKNIEAIDLSLQFSPA